MIDPRSSSTTGYHLFIEPEGNMKDELSSVIQKLAQKYGGPVFTPHVTLLARIPAEKEGEESPESVDELIEKTQALVASFSPFTLTLGHFGAEDAYFKALYLHIKEQTEMREHHAKALEAFSMTDEAPYIPHLSLLYGNYPNEQKHHTIESLVLPGKHSFVVKSLYLYKTKGEVNDWSLIKEFPFGE